MLTSALTSWWSFIFATKEPKLWISGTVTNGDVAEAIEAATKKDIDRRDITVPDIHNLGSFVAKIKLHQEVSAEINIEVTS